MTIVPITTVCCSLSAVMANLIHQNARMVIAIYSDDHCSHNLEQYPYLSFSDTRNFRFRYSYFSSHVKPAKCRLYSLEGFENSTSGFDFPRRKRPQLGGR